MSFRIAKKQALKSKFGRHRVGAVIVKGNRVLSTGYNERRYSNITKHSTIHAEEAAVVALLKERRFSDLAGSSIYVTRYTAGGSIGLAKPCGRCSKLLRSVGVNRCYYSDNDGYGELKLNV